MDTIDSTYPKANPNPITKCTKPKYVKERKARNPLRCERTPRTHFQEEERWSYSVPPGEEFEDKWKYDREDRPLMENFASLRAGVAAYDEKVRAHHSRIKAFQDSQALLAATQTGGLVSTRSSARRTARDSSRLTGRSSQGDHDSARPQDAVQGRDTGRTTSRSNPFASARTGRASGRSAPNTQELTSFPASSLKGLQHDHPDILAQARAQRAAQYVTTLHNPLVPPSYNSTSSRQSFFPAGTNSLHRHPDEEGGSKKKTLSSKNKHKEASSRSSGKILLTSRNLDTSRMQESLTTLVDELAKTDSQIARQELKIALAPKVKTFDKKGSKK